MGRNKAWSPEHVKQLEADLSLIVSQSGGNGISQSCAAITSLSNLFGRSTMAVALKARQLALKKGLIKTRKEIEQQQQSAKMVVVPLEKLYGKVDFNTFMTFINE